MGTSPVSIFLVVLGLSATLGAGPTGVQAAGNHAPDEDTTTTPNMTTGGQDGQCSPLQRRQDLLDTRLTERDTRLTERDARLTERDADLNTRLNGLNTRQNEVDARLNRIDGRFDDLETAMSDMKEYLRQRMDAMEVKAEWALAGSKHKGEVESQDKQPASTAPSTTTTTEVPHNVPKDCQEAYTMGLNSSGIYRIAPEPGTEFEVLCDQELDGGGWLVFQLRKDGRVNFYQDWNVYRAGFGELTGEFWLGNSKIHLLTEHRDQQLKIQLTSNEGEVEHADYTHFWIGNEAQKFELSVRGFSGGSPPGDSLAYHNGQKFSTRDEDNDSHRGMFCARDFCTGAWWYRSCQYSNLNGQYGSRLIQKGINWRTWTGPNVSMKATKMMIRKKR